MRSDNWGDFSMRSTCDSSINSSLGYLTPVEFEQQWLTPQASQQGLD
jgi:hypothetical protein